MDGIYYAYMRNAMVRKGKELRKTFCPPQKMRDFAKAQHETWN
tara:strand:- start:657 stop:785 length:129 start_codon:yes stop_codon:yes gene_type:complete